MGSGNSVHLYNVTPFKLEVVATDRQGEKSVSATNDPINSRLLSMQDLWVSYPRLTVTAKDSNGTPIKEVTFYSSCNRSWIVSDAEIRKRDDESNSPHVADEYSNEEKEAYFSDKDDYKWTQRDKIKQYDWTNLKVSLHGATCPCVLYTAAGPDTDRAKSWDRRCWDLLREMNRGALGDCNQQHSMHIYNDSPYLLVIQQQTPTSSRLYVSDPHYKRIVKLCSDDDYPFVVINVVNMDVGHVVKSTSFYSYGSYSWIVNDECVLRQKGDAPRYVADEYTESEKEESHWTKPDYKWTMCNKIKCYCWIPQSKTFCDLFRNMWTTVKHRKSKSVTPAAASCFITANSGEVLNQDILIALSLVEWISFDNLLKRSGSAASSDGDDNILIDGNKTYNKMNGNHSNSHQADTVVADFKTTDLKAFRLEQQPRLSFQHFWSGQTHYDVFVILHESRHLSSVYIHSSAADVKIPDHRLRHAFLWSLFLSSEVYISAEEEKGSGVPTIPPDSKDSLMSHVLLFGYPAVKGNRRVCFWGRRQ